MTSWFVTAMPNNVWISQNWHSRRAVLSCTVVCHVSSVCLIEFGPILAGRPRPHPFISLRCLDWNNNPVSDHAETATFSHVMVNTERDPSCGPLVPHYSHCHSKLAVKWQCTQKGVISKLGASKGNLAMLSSLCSLCNDLGFRPWSHCFCHFAWSFIKA